MRYLISTICIVLLLWGCDNTSAVPMKPKVVRKKVAAPKGHTVNVRRAETDNKAETKLTAKPQTQTDVAKVDQTQAVAKRQPVADKDNSARLVIVKKIKNQPVPKARTDVAKVDQTQAVVKRPPVASGDRGAQSVIVNKIENQPVPKTQMDVAKVDQAQTTAENQVGDNGDTAVRSATVNKIENQPVSKTQAVVAKVDNTQTGAANQLVADKDNGARSVIVKKAENMPAPSKQHLPGKHKKPSLSPKAEITLVKPAVKNRIQPGGDAIAADTKLKATGLITASNSLTGAVPAIYDPSDKIDPFEPLFREKRAITKEEKKIKRAPQTPLERIDLSQLKLVGIILAASGNRALVEESSGKGYVIKKGTYIGTNGGQIVNIQREKVTVEEKFEDVFGKIKSRSKELKLPKPPGEF